MKYKIKPATSWASYQADIIAWVEYEDGSIVPIFSDEKVDGDGNVVKR